MAAHIDGNLLLLLQVTKRTFFRELKDNKRVPNIRISSWPIDRSQLQDGDLVISLRRRTDKTSFLQFNISLPSKKDKS